MPLEHAPTESATGYVTAPKVVWAPSEWCQEAGIGLTRFYEELKLGRIKAKKSGKRTLVLTPPLVWLESLPDAQSAAA